MSEKDIFDKINNHEFDYRLAFEMVFDRLTKDLDEPITIKQVYETYNSIIDDVNNIK